MVRLPTFAVITVDTASVPIALTSNPLPLATTLTSAGSYVSLMSRGSTQVEKPSASYPLTVKNPLAVASGNDTWRLDGASRIGVPSTVIGNRPRACPRAAVTVTSPAWRPVTIPWLVTLALLPDDQYGVPGAGGVRLVVAAAGRARGSGR